MFIWSCGGLAPFLMRMICCEDGRSQGAEFKPAPFNSLTAANGITLKAGEFLLFKAGTTCTSATQTIDGASVKTGLRVINAKGTKDAPITIGAYGEGAAPIIAGADVSETILLKNSEYITVQGFEVTNTDANAADYEKYMRRGIAVDARQRRQHEEQRHRRCHSAPEVRTEPDRRRSLRRVRGEQLTPYKGDTINQRTLSETPGKRRTVSACVRRSKEQRRHPVHAQGAGQVQPRVAWRRQLVQPVPQDRAERDRGRRKQGRRQNSLQRVVHRAARRGPVCRAVGRHLADRSGLRLVFAYIDNVTLVEDSAAVSDVASIAVTTQPTKTEYAIGDALDLSGMAVTATMSDGTPPSSARANTRSPSSTRRPPAKRPSR